MEVNKAGTTPVFEELVFSKKTDVKQIVILKNQLMSCVVNAKKLRSPVSKITCMNLFGKLYIMTEMNDIIIKISVT